MATKMGMKRTEPQKPLKRHLPLTRRKPINYMSDKAKKELKIWLAMKNLRMILLKEKYGYVPCEYCKKAIVENSELYHAEGHHNNHNRRDNTLDNCRILHRTCNQQIEDLNIKDVPSML